MDNDMRRDGRNAYGAKGGYVRDRARDRDMDMDYDYADMDYDYEMDSRYDSQRDSRYDRRYNDGRRYDIEMTTRDNYSRRDRHKSKTLDDSELKKWSKKLMSEMEDKYKQFFKMEHIMKKAEEMGIRFDMFTPFEFYTTVLMMFSDFKEALSTANADIYIKLAKYWLCDEDAEMQYGEKLKAYYENIVNGF